LKFEISFIKLKKSEAFAGIIKLKKGKCEMIYKALIIPRIKESEADIRIFAANVPITTPLLPVSVV